MTRNFNEIESICWARHADVTSEEYASQPDGFWAARAAWRRTKRLDWNVDEHTVVVDEVPWSDESADFIAALRDNNIDTIILTYSGSRLMDALAEYHTLGANIVGLTKIEKKHPAPLFDEPQNAIKIHITTHEEIHDKIQDFIDNN